jgi:hypothetical protein
LSLMACLAIGASTEAPGAVVIQNTPATADGGSTVSETDWKALLFTSGASAGVVDSLTLGLNPPTNGSVPATYSVRVSLYSVVSGTPAVSLAAIDLMEIDMSAFRQTYALPLTEEFSLQPHTPYALVVSSDATGIRWSNNSVNPPVASDGFQYDGFLVTGNSGANWVAPASMANVLVLGFVAVPEPEWGSLLAGAGLAAGAIGLNRRPGRARRTG